MFENVIWPVGCVYNLKSEGSAKTGGSADVDFVYKTNKIKYIKQKREVKESVQGYCCDRQEQVSAS